MSNELEVVKNALDQDRTGGIRFFDSVRIGDYDVSLQASEFHYCTPRKTLPSLNDYTAFEVALFDSDGTWINPRTHVLFSDKSWVECFETQGKSPVAGYMSRADVNAMVADLLRVSG